MKTIPRAIALSALTAVALTGCVRFEMNVDLHSDDTATTEVIAALTQEAADQVGSGLFDQVLETEEDDDVVTEAYESEELDDNGNPLFVGARGTRENQPLDDLNLIVGDLTVVRDGDDFVVSGSPIDLAAETGEEVPDDADASISFTFPGEVTSHNGQLDGTTVTWDLTTHTDPIEARGGATSGGFPAWLIIAIIALVGVGIGMAVVLVTSGKRRPTGDDDPESYLEGHDGIQGTVNTADAGSGTVAPAAEPVVDADEVVDTTEDEGRNRP